MELLELKKRITDYQSGIVFDDNPNYVSILVVERYFKKKYEEYRDKTAAFVRDLERIVKFKIEHISSGGDLYTKKSFQIYGFEKWNKLLPHIKGHEHRHSIDIDFETSEVRWYMNGGYIELSRSLASNSLIQDYIAYLKNFISAYEIYCFRQPTNVGLFVDMCFNAVDEIFVINVSDNDCPRNFAMPYPFNFDRDGKSELESSEPLSERELSRNFYYFKNVLGTQHSLECYGMNLDVSILEALFPSLKVRESGVQIDREDARDFLNEELLNALYPCLKVDVSRFSKQVQEELVQIEYASRIKLSREMQEKLATFKELQTAKLMKAYELVKETTLLLEGIQSTIEFERIKLDNISSIIFKNNGNPTANGCIEFEDFFRNNSVLRMLDLSTLSLDNVDIRGMDFSGTNVHIDPQRICKKDMTNVNATGLKFSPFTDSFIGVILDGATITDKEANIDLNTVGSYDSATVIKDETNMVM